AGPQACQVRIHARVGQADVELGHAAERSLQTRPQATGESATRLLALPGRRRAGRTAALRHTVPQTVPNARRDPGRDLPSDLLPDPGTDGADRALHGRAERAPRRLPGLLTGTSTRRHQRGPKPRLDPPSVGGDIERDGVVAAGVSSQLVPPAGAVGGGLWQVVKLGAGGLHGELRGVPPPARTGPALRLRRVRPLALLLGIDAVQHPLQAADGVVVR